MKSVSNYYELYEKIFMNPNLTDHDKEIFNKRKEVHDTINAGPLKGEHYNEFMERINKLMQEYFTVINADLEYQEAFCRDIPKHEAFKCLDSIIEDTLMGKAKTLDDCKTAQEIAEFNSDPRRVTIRRALDNKEIYRGELIAYIDKRLSELLAE